MEGQFIYRAPDGSEQDVSEDVGALYDLLIDSMDWGSGFLTVEDSLHAVRIGELGGFERVEQARSYVDAQAHSKEQAEFLARGGHHDAVRPMSPGHLFTGLAYTERIEHDHVFSTVGKCMWRHCWVTSPEHYTAGPLFK